MTRLLAAALGLGGLFLLTAVACNTPPEAPPRGSSSGSSGDDDPPPASRRDAGDDDRACDELSESACETCCAEQHPDGKQALDNAVLGCLCGDPGLCKTECADTLCAAPVKAADSACKTCSDPEISGECKPLVDEACGLEADCEPYRLCVGNCG